MRKEKILLIILLIIAVSLIPACQSAVDGESASSGAVSAAPEEEADDIEENEDLSSENQSEQTVTIQAEADGTPISAKLKKGGDDLEEEVKTEDLPFAVHVSYQLDGVEISADDLAGKSGDLCIRFDYENLSRSKASADGKEAQSIVPFVFLSVLSLPEDRFSDIEVENGGVSGLAENRLVYGYAIPGLEDALALEPLRDKLDSTVNAMSDGEKSFSEPWDIPEYVEVNCHTSNCKIDFTATMVMNGFFKEIEEEDLTDLDADVRDLSEVAEDGNDFADGVKKLKDGSRKFAGGLKDYTDGVDQLSEGADELASGSRKIAKQNKALKNGASGLAKGLGALNKALSEFDLSTMVEVPDMEKIASDAEEAALKALESNETLTEEERNAMAAAAGSAAAQAAMNALVSPADDLDSEDPLLGLKASVLELAEGASQLSEGVDAYTEGVGALAAGASQLADGAETLSGAGSELRKGYKGLDSGIGELKKAVDEMNEELFQQIGALSYGALPDTIERLRVLRNADCGFTAWDTYDGEEGSIRFILETAEIKK